MGEQLGCSRHRGPGDECRTPGGLRQITANRRLEPEERCLDSGDRCQELWRDVGEHLFLAFLCLLSGTRDGDWRRSEVGAGSMLCTEATVLGAESDLVGSEAGARANSIRSARRRMSHSFLVHGLKLLQMQHYSLIRHTTAGMEPAQITAAVMSIVNISCIILQYVQNQTL
ncbi:hypothetical protein UY3_12712 [Chelonia mydas]|uniref:Uncharacterized protein n=1 Tax=Chelonia mydas TaxID=8469 RepID=M7BDD6_CHEMY|nr:hypothetical protein UY3_12712 [Chelonia mydas]